MKKLYTLTIDLLISIILVGFFYIVGVVGTSQLDGEITTRSIANIVIIIAVMTLIILIIHNVLHIVCGVLSAICIINLWLIIHELKECDTSSAKTLIHLYKRCGYRYSKVFKMLFDDSLSAFKASLDIE